MLRTNSKQAKINVRNLIISLTDTYQIETGSKYDYILMYTDYHRYIEGTTYYSDRKNKYVDLFSVYAPFIYGVFQEEMSKDNRYQAGRISDQQLFFEWLQGLPGAINMCDIFLKPCRELVGHLLEETPEEISRYTEEDAEKLIQHLIYREIKTEIDRQAMLQTKRGKKS